MEKHRTIAYENCEDGMAFASKGEIARLVSSGSPPLLNFQTAPVMNLLFRNWLRFKVRELDDLSPIQSIFLTAKKTLVCWLNARGTDSVLAELAFCLPRWFEGPSSPSILSLRQGGLIWSTLK
jgi:hypothetical protein